MHLVHLCILRSDNTDSFVCGIVIVDFFLISFLFFPYLLKVLSMATEGFEFPFPAMF